MTTTTTDSKLGSALKKSPGMKKKSDTTAKKGAKGATPVAFLNWKTQTKDGADYYGNMGIGIFQDTQYSDPKWKPILEAAEREGGEVTLTMEVTIRIAKPKVDVDSSAF